jgi:hypothetical protein
MKAGLAVAMDMIACNGISYDRNGIKNRLLRTYPSLIRDLHFFYLLKNSNKFESVSYSLDADYYNGTDLKIEYQLKSYFISVFISSKRSIDYKNKKKDRHDYSNIPEIALKPELASLKRVGEFNLLTMKHVEEVIDKINNFK